MTIDAAGRRATRMAKAWSDLLWWTALLVAALMAMLFLLSPVLLKSGMNEVAVPVSVGEPRVVRTRPLPSADTAFASQVMLEERDTTHHLQFRTTDWRMFLAVNWVLLVPIAALLIATRIFRSFLADVLAADVFTPANARRLAKLGWLAIGVAILAPPLQYWRSWIVLRRMELEGVSLSPARPEWFDGSVVYGLLLLVLASAWRYGVELQRDRDLTV